MEFKKHAKLTLLKLQKKFVGRTYPVNHLALSNTLLLVILKKPFMHLIKRFIFILTKTLNWQH